MNLVPFSSVKDSNYRSLPLKRKWRYKIAWLLPKSGSIFWILRIIMKYNVSKRVWVIRLSWVHLWLGQMMMEAWGLQMQWSDIDLRKFCSIQWSIIVLEISQFCQKDPMRSSKDTTWMSHQSIQLVSAIPLTSYAMSCPAHSVTAPNQPYPKSMKVK